MTARVEVSNARVFAIAGPAMLTNVTTPLLGVVATAAIGRLGVASLLGGVAMASVAFDCIFWLFDSRLQLSCFKIPDVYHSIITNACDLIAIRAPCH